MGEATKISWTDATWNPIRGCSRVSEGCRNCYAERVAARFSGAGQPYEGLAVMRDPLPGTRSGRPAWTGVVRVVAEHLADPLRWKKPRRIFVNSMSDLFHESLTNEQIAAVFGVMAACPQHTFQVLTKRSKRMREWFAWAERHGDGYTEMRFSPSALMTCAWEACSGDAWGDVEPPGVLESLPSAGVFGSAWPLQNVWLGVSVENQSAADDRIPDLLATPARVRILSCEPMLAAVDLLHVQHGGEFEVDALTGDHGVTRPLAGRGPRIDWVIAGCESGPGARPCDVEWLRALRDQCAASGVAFFAKQAKPIDGAYTITDRRPVPIVAGRFGELIPVISEGPGSKRKAGGVIELPYLDGVQHKEFPNADR